MTGDTRNIPGAGKWGGTNRRVMVVPGGKGERRFETRDEAWWENYRKSTGVK